MSKESEDLIGVLTRITVALERLAYPEIPIWRREPIFIAATPFSDHCQAYETVVCNDGTIWRLEHKEPEKWYRLPDIPQDKEE